MGTVRRAMRSSVRTGVPQGGLVYAAFWWSSEDEVQSLRLVSAISRKRAATSGLWREV